MKKEAFVIYTIIQGKVHYVSETMKIFTGQKTPGYNKNIAEAIIFDTSYDATSTIGKIRDFHGREFKVEKTETDSKKTIASYNRLQNQKELN
jgi:hypothetical protein